MDEVVAEFEVIRKGLSTSKLPSAHSSPLIYILYIAFDFSFLLLSHVGYNVSVCAFDLSPLVCHLVILLLHLLSIQRHERLHGEEHAEKTDGRPELLHSVIGLYPRVMNCEG
jgi:hypothetical protein